MFNGTVRLLVEPATGLVDAEPAVRVDGAAPGALVTLTLEVTDAARQRWRSANTYVADASGTVDVARDAPVRGSYAGVDGSAPWWSMRFVGAEATAVAFTAPADALLYRCLATDASGNRVAVDATRLWLRAATASRIRGAGFVGACFDPDGGGRGGAGIVVVPGSTGVSAMTPLAALLASHGYRAMVLGYMHEPGLPQALNAIPVERLADGIRAFAGRAGVDRDRLAVVCASVGAGGALAALAYLQVAVRGVVAIAPSSVIWQALANGRPPPKASSWTLDGRPLPWLRLAGERLVPQLVLRAIRGAVARRPVVRALRMRPAYAPGLRDPTAVERAAIPVERINAPLLVLSGRDDAMWPSEQMADQLLARRRTYGVAAADRQLTFPGAGHFLRPPITPTTVARSADLVAGGTADGTARAQRQAWDAILAFLDRCTQPAA
jgi:BAAT / Acyl-CoA thioester hydrolase C terminal/Acyl-CoA thioester hydrolase/BAAT N-terminal region